MKVNAEASSGVYVQSPFELKWLQSQADDAIGNGQVEATIVEYGRMLMHPARATGCTKHSNRIFVQKNAVNRNWRRLRI